MDIDVSIIIPMYNTGQFINECINSIKSSSLNLEIIIIDDGSEDDSFQIVSKMAKNDERIILVRTLNFGPGKARNLGLCKAKGKYITFMDSDDWIIENALDVLYKEITDNNLDIVIGNALFYYHEKDIRKRYKIPASLFGKIHQGKECYISLSNTNSFIPMVYCYMYKYDFLKKNKIHFQKEMYEDELWTLQTVCLANRIKIIDYPFYYYRQRTGSIMHGGLITNKKSNSLIALSGNIFTFSQNYSFANDNDLKSWLYVRAIQMFYYAIMKFSEKDDAVAFYENNADILKELTKDENEIGSNMTLYLFRYYLRNIVNCYTALPMI
jgi:glycosyltransferase involved in cell wall biosynthesis